MARAIAAGVASAVCLCCAFSRAGIADTAENSPEVRLTAVVRSILLTADRPGQLDFEASMDLRFSNVYSKPVLLFVGDRWPWLGDVYLAASAEDALAGRFVFRSGSWPASARQGWESVRSELRGASSPPSKYIRILNPGESFEETVHVEFSIEKAGSFDKRSLPWNQIKALGRVWLQLRYATWPNNLESASGEEKFAKYLRSKWRHSGELITDTVSSAPVAVVLPE